MMCKKPTNWNKIRLCMPMIYLGAQISVLILVHIVSHMSGRKKKCVTRYEQNEIKCEAVAVATIKG